MSISTQTVNECVSMQVAYEKLLLPDFSNSMKLCKWDYSSSNCRHMIVESKSTGKKIFKWK